MSRLLTQIEGKRTSVQVHDSTLYHLEVGRRKDESKEEFILRLLSFQSLVKKMERQIKRLQEINTVDPQVVKLREEVLEAVAKLEQADIEG